MSENNRDLMEQFIRLEALIHRYQMHSLRHFGPFGNLLRGQGRVLSILKLQPVISQKELGYLLDIRNRSLGELLNKLENSGYITRTPSEEDKRTTVITLTTEGAEAAGEAADRPKHFDDLFACLADEEQANLSNYLERIIAELDKQLEGSEGGGSTFGGAPFDPRGGGHPFHRKDGPEEK